MGFSPSVGACACVYVTTNGAAVVASGRTLEKVERTAGEIRTAGGEAFALRCDVGAQADIDRVLSIWRDCLATFGGPYLFGASPNMADAMYAPVCTRLVTYDVDLDDVCASYCATMTALPAMAEWAAAAAAEPEDVEELDIEF